MAFLGITYQIVYHERYKLLETCCYVAVALLPAIVIIDMVGDLLHGWTCERTPFAVIHLS